MKAGDTISGYTLLQECGKGTFGKVFLAENAMEEKVAFKAVSALGTYAERELQALKSYQKCSRGTHLLQIYHAELTEDYLFYTMELADPFSEPEAEHYVADTLAARLGKYGKLSVKETMDILRSLLADLKILHDHELIHRDIKPANIVFTNGEAKLGDIGLLANNASMTIEAGTPLYIPSPESGIKGNSIEADLYALAKTIYCCLSGNTPDKFPEVDITDDIKANGKELLNYIYTSCTPQKNFHSVMEILKKYPFEKYVTLSPDELYEIFEIKYKLKKQLEALATQTTSPVEKKSFLNKLQNTHPRLAGFIGILVIIGFQLLDLLCSILDCISLPITISILLFQQMMSKKKSRKI